MLLLFNVFIFILIFINRDCLLCMVKLGFFPAFGKTWFYSSSSWVKLRKTLSGIHFSRGKWNCCLWHILKELFKTFKLVFVWTPYLHFSSRYWVQIWGLKPPNLEFQQKQKKTIFQSRFVTSSCGHIWTYSSHCLNVNIRKINQIYITKNTRNSCYNN